MKTTIALLNNSTPRSPWRSVLLLVSLLLVCVGLSPRAQAVNPPPDGGYGNQNTAEGTDALFSLTSGVWNVAVGFQALKNDTIGNQNTAVGYRALFSNINGDKSTAYGSQALLNNTTGTENVATGFSTLSSNIAGNRNTGVGYRTLAFNNADDNTAIGWNGLFNNRTGVQNTAIGSGALLHGSDNSENTAVGYLALYDNDTGNRNTAVGSTALSGNMGGSDNTATGAGALGCFNGSGNTANGANALLRCRPDSSGGGSNNTAVGAGAFSSGDSNDIVQNNTVLGAQALPLPTGGGNNNIAIGYRAGANLPFGDNNIEIGNAGDSLSGDGSTIRIGDVQIRTFIAGIRGVTTGMADAVPVVIDSAGQLGTVSSSQRFKHEIKPMDRASEAILALKPVRFEYKSDKTNRPQFGLIAEQVAEVNRDLVVRDTQGEIYTVRYDAVNAMLLNEFLKAHRKVEELEAAVSQLTHRLDEQESKTQKMGNQLESGRPASQVVANR